MQAYVKKATAAVYKATMTCFVEKAAAAGIFVDKRKQFILRKGM
jgi:hypothetical protein